MGRAYQEHQERQREAAEQAAQEANVVYQNPVVNSSYDPDGLQELFEEDYIDWDAFEWDSWNWVVNTPEGEEGEGVSTASVADGAGINFGYYANDPLFQMAFANLDIDANELSLGDLQSATKHVVETFRSVMNDNYRPPWKKELPAPYVPTELKSDYVTPFDMPRAVHPTIGALMSRKVRDLHSRSGAWHAKANNQLQAVASANPQQGSSPESRANA